MLKLGECDCCGDERPLRMVTAFGIDTAACAICRGGTEKDLEEEFADLEDDNAR